MDNKAKKVSHDTEIASNRCMRVFRDWNSMKLGGIRGVQNKSIILADCISGLQKKPIIYHKLDDDIFAYIASFEKGMLKIMQGYNIFGHKAKLLNSIKGIIGSRYHIDSPSPLADLNESLIDLEKLLNAISQFKNSSEFNASWKKTAKQFFTLPQAIIDESNLIKTPGAPLLYANKTYTEIIDLLVPLMNILRNGNNRFVFNVEELLSPSFYSLRDCLPGGFVSFYSDLEIRPVVRGANQDLLFSALEFACGNTVYGDWPVGHIKEGDKRNKLLDDLKYNPSSIGSRKNDFLTTFCILKLAQEEGLPISYGLNKETSILHWGLKLISPHTIEYNVAAIKIHLKKIKDKFNQKRLNCPIDTTEKFICEIQNELNNIERMYTFENIPAEVMIIAKELYQQWKEDIPIFQKFRYYAKQSKWNVLKNDS